MLQFPIPKNTLCTLTAYGYAPAPYVAPVAHAGPLTYHINDDDDNGDDDNDDNNASSIIVKFSFSSQIDSNWSLIGKYCSFSVTHNQTCPQSFVTHKILNAKPFLLLQFLYCSISLRPSSPVWLHCCPVPCRSVTPSKTQSTNFMHIIVTV